MVGWAGLTSMRLLSRRRAWPRSIMNRGVHSSARFIASWNSLIRRAAVIWGPSNRLVFLLSSGRAEPRGVVRAYLILGRLGHRGPLPPLVRLVPSPRPDAEPPSPVLNGQRWLVPVRLDALVAGPQ